MGYEYDLFAWTRTRTPADLSAVAAVTADDPYHAHLNLRVTGPNRDYVHLFDASKWNADAALKVVSALPNTIASLATLTGEISYDGKDLFLLSAGSPLQTLPLARLYDPASPWNALYEWTHYLSRRDTPLPPLNPAALATHLAGCTSTKGWIHLAHEERPAATALLARLTAHPALADAFTTGPDPYDPTIHLGTNALPSAAVAEHVARALADLPKTPALLTCSADDERTQLPLALRAGNLQPLPAVDLSAEPLFPFPPTVAQGLRAAHFTFPLASTLSRSALCAQIRRALGDPAAHLDTPARTFPNRPDCHLWTHADLLLTLCHNHGHALPAADWPYLLYVQLNTCAGTRHLLPAARTLAAALRVAQIPLAPDPLIQPTFDSESARDTPRTPALALDLTLNSILNSQPSTSHGITITGHVTLPLPTPPTPPAAGKPQCDGPHL